MTAIQDIVATGPTVPAADGIASWRTVLVREYGGDEVECPYVVYAVYHPETERTEQLYGVYCEDLGEGLREFQRRLEADIREIQRQLYPPQECAQPGVDCSNGTPDNRIGWALRTPCVGTWRTPPG